MHEATFGAGCFWGVEVTFRQVDGVKDTAVGYAGGTVAHPTYEAVCSKQTGHAEVVRVMYNPDVVSYEQLLHIFFSCHDPTTLNRQGPDVGAQYRSVIFYHDEAQRIAAVAFKERLERAGRYERPIVTEVVPVPTFYRAEAYHQQYLEKRGLAHCRV